MLNINCTPLNFTPRSTPLHSIPLHILLYPTTPHLIQLYSTAKSPPRSITFHYSLFNCSLQHAPLHSSSPPLFIPLPFSSPPLFTPPPPLSSSPSLPSSPPPILSSSPPLITPFPPLYFTLHLTVEAKAGEPWSSAWIVRLY